MEHRIGFLPSPSQYLHLPPVQVMPDFMMRLLVINQTVLYSRSSEIIFSKHLTVKQCASLSYLFYQNECVRFIVLNQFFKTIKCILTRHRLTLKSNLFRTPIIIFIAKDLTKFLSFVIMRKSSLLVLGPCFLGQQQTLLFAFTLVSGP